MMAVVAGTLRPGQKRGTGVLPVIQHGQHGHGTSAGATEPNGRRGDPYARRGNPRTPPWVPSFAELTRAT
jgi:hypothetical protein